MMRRTLLQFLGLAPVAAVTSVAGVAKDTAISSVASSAISAVAPSGGMTSGGHEIGKLVVEATKQNAKNALLKQMKPAWWMQKHIRNAKDIANDVIAGRSSDYRDIMALKSVSLAGKRSMIIDREIKRQIEEADLYSFERISRLLWLQSTGHERDIDDFF